VLETSPKSETLRASKKFLAKKLNLKDLGEAAKSMTMKRDEISGITVIEHTDQEHKAWSPVVILHFPENLRGMHLNEDSIDQAF
jgi:hypothetical protein